MAKIPVNAGRISEGVPAPRTVQQSNASVVPNRRINPDEFPQKAMLSASLIDAGNGAGEAGPALTREAILSKGEILPNSICQRTNRTVTWGNGMRWIPIFCANCGADGGMVLEVDWELVKNFAFYLCDPCATSWAPLTNVAIAPDEYFWEKVRHCQLEDYGRMLTEAEIINELQKGDSKLAVLCRERYQAKGAA